jgi:hypothetical protein
MTVDGYQMSLYTHGMSKHKSLAAVIREAIERDERSLYAIAKLASISYQALHPFFRGHREEITLGTASRLCRVLGLELRPTTRRKKG